MIGLDLVRRIFGSKRMNQVDRIVVFSSEHAAARHDFDIKDPKPLSRDQALTFIPFGRCVSLLSKVTASIIEQSVYVVDRDNRIVDTPTTQAVLRLLTETPNGDESSLSFLKDVVSDYLIDGNLLFEVKRGMEMKPTELVRLDAENALAEIVDEKRGRASMVYRSNEIATGMERVVPTMNVVHARFHSKEGNIESRGRRRYFARSNLFYMANAIRLGIEGDTWVQDFFDAGQKSDLVVELPAAMSQDSIETWIKYLAEHADSRSPLILPEGATIKKIGSTPSDASSIEQREYQIQEISRLYGVPAPLIGLNVTQWGSGIEQLARLLYRFGVKPDLDNILASMSLKMLRRGLKFRVDVTEEIKGDTAAMTNLISSMRPSTNTPPVMSQKEARDLLGLKGDLDDDWDFRPPSGNAVDRSDDSSDHRSTEPEPGAME